VLTTLRAIALKIVKNASPVKNDKNFKVTFTAVYNFFYGYDSKLKSSGDIKDKISWSCNVEYVGDDSDSSGSSSNYSDYHINGKAIESQKVSREDTVK